MAPPENFGTMGRVARRKLANDNDVKIIIQGSNSQTGIGKTTLAIQLCRYIDRGWSAEDKAFIDVPEYIEAHLNKSKGSALLLDEIEAGADNRRAMSHENVELSQAWATMRARNIATVATLPSISMLDNRMLEMADFWVLVTRRGVAKPHFVNVNDYAPGRNPQKKPLPGGEHIKFRDLPDDDADKEYLDKIKDDMLRGKMDDVTTLTAEEHKAKVEQEREEAEREKRNELICEIYNSDSVDVSTTDLSDITGVSQTHVSHVLNSD